MSGKLAVISIFFVHQVDSTRLVLTARTLVEQFVLHMPAAFKPHVDAGTSDPFLPEDPWLLLERGQFNQVG